MPDLVSGCILLGSDHGICRHFLLWTGGLLRHRCLCIGHYFSKIFSTPYFCSSAGRICGRSAGCTGGAAMPETQGCLHRSGDLCRAYDSGAGSKRRYRPGHWYRRFTGNSYHCSHEHFWLHLQQLRADSLLLSNVFSGCRLLLYHSCRY